MKIKKSMASLYRSPFFYVLFLILASVVVYVITQQSLRRAADYPQKDIIKLVSTQAANSTLSLESITKQSIDLSKDESPFVIVYDENGDVLASSAVLRGRIPTIPQTIFADIKNSGEKTFTWQPDSDVRIAAVMKYFDGITKGFVLVGRLLTATEMGENYMLKIVIIAMITGVSIQIIIELWKRFVFKK